MSFMSIYNICTNSNIHRFPQFSKSRFNALLMHRINSSFTYQMFPSEKYPFHFHMLLWWNLQVSYQTSPSSILLSTILSYREHSFLISLTLTQLSKYLSFFTIFWCNLFHRYFWISFLNPLQCTVRASHMAQFHYLGLEFVLSCKYNIMHTFSTVADTKTPNFLLQLYVCG